VANFNTHALVAGVISSAAAGYALRESSIAPVQALLLFASGTLGGLAPDIDSDHSTPAQWVFHLLSIAAGTMVWMALYHQLDIQNLLLATLAGVLVMRYGIIVIFERLTDHRGMFHSIPAAILAGLIVCAAGRHLWGWSAHFSWLLALFVSAGYAVHLLLDELYSVNLAGLKMKRSFGTAFKLFSPAAWKRYLPLYATIIGLAAYLPPPQW